MKQLSRYMFECESIEEEKEVLMKVLTDGTPAPPFHQDVVKEAFPEFDLKAFCMNGFDYEEGTILVLPKKKTTIFISR